MKTSKYLIASVVGLVVVVIAAVFVGISVRPESVGGAPSPVGTTFNTAKIAATEWSIFSASATTTSLYNGDATDRYISSEFSFCTGLGTSQTAYTGTGLAALTFTAATTSTSAPAVLSAVNTNYIFNSTIATSTAVGFVASTTEGVLSGYSRVWPSASYLTFSTNATNTAQCLVGVHYLAS